MLREGPGRRHGDPLIRRSMEETEKLDQHEKRRQKRDGLTREERIARGPQDLSELTGDPNVLPEDIADPDAPPREFIEGAEKLVDAHLEAMNERAMSMGIRQDEPMNDRQITDEYYGGPPPGLSQGTLAAERERLSKPFHFMSRSDIEAHNEALAWTDGLREDFVTAYPELAANPADVEAAARRVWAKWSRQGTRDLKRRVQTDRNSFLDQVADELVLTPMGYERERDGDAGRTAGLDSSIGGGRGHTREADVEQPSTLSKELRKDQEGSGYW